MNTSREYYLDCAATTPMRSDVIAAMEPFQRENFANPSSRHGLGVRAARSLSASARRIAALLGARQARVVFTSGGTEANNLALLGAARQAPRRRRRVVVAAIEHPSILEPARALAHEGFELTIVPPQGDGVIALDPLLEACDEQTAVVALMLVNNETGAVQPVAEFARNLARRAPLAHLHVDAVQAPGRVELRFDRLGAHSLALCAHKIGGPKGCGALLLRDGTQVQPLLHGGGQQGGLRPGTEQPGAAAGLTRALELAVAEREERDPRLRRIESTLLARLRGACARMSEHVPAERRVPGIVSIAFEGVPGEVLLHHLAAEGIYVSTGSACSAARAKPSHVLLAQGIREELVRCTIRLSFGTELDDDALENIAERIAHSVAALRELSGP